MILPWQQLWGIAIGGDKGPASIDLHTDVPGDYLSVYLTPGESWLFSTKERVEMPDNMAGLVVLRSSAFRKGLSLASPGYVDPGFSGNLTFRITNVTKEQVIIDPNERLIQLIVFKLAQTTDRPYKGNYQDSEGIVVS